MNIIYMHTHDTGRYIQPYGYHIPTPRLMEMAQEGILFRQAFCAGPTCSPSRAGLLTGMSPHSCGMIGLAHRGFHLNDYRKHLVQFLNEHEYETVLCGVQHEAPWNRIQEWIGYQKNISSSGQNKGFRKHDLDNAREAAAYLKEKKNKPFFLSFGMVNTHREYLEVDEEINPNYVMPPLPMYDNKDTREDMARFMSSAKVVDQCVGIVLDAVKEAGIEEETLIIFTTDHGIAFPRMKCSLYDTGIGVSLIMRLPGNQRKGEVVDALVSQIDIFPTLCDLAGLDKPDWLQGHSMLPLLRGTADKIRDEIFSEVTYHAAYEPKRCIRTERYKLIRYYDDHNHFVPANIDDGLSKSFLMDHGYLEGKQEKEMLFDLYMDPSERVNLLGDPKYEEVYRDLSRRLEGWMEETGDPLLKGKVEKPEGATANKVTCISPGSKNPEDYE